MKIPQELSTREVETQSAFQHSLEVVPIDVTMREREGERGREREGGREGGREREMAGRRERGSSVTCIISQKETKNVLFAICAVNRDMC